MYLVINLCTCLFVYRIIYRGFISISYLSINLFPSAVWQNADPMRTCRIDNVTLDVGPWELYTLKMYQQDLRVHDIVVEIRSREDRSLVYRALKYSTKFGGRGLTGNVLVNGTQLMLGDRLEPSPELLGVDGFQSKDPPFTIHFWRGGDEDRLTHASPLLRIEGVSHQRHGIDTLHSWHLGPLCRYIYLVLKLFVNGIC